MMFVIFGVAAGVSWAFLRYPFLPLLPMGALLATGAALTGIAFGTHPGVTAVEVFRIHRGAAVRIRRRQPHRPPHSFVKTDTADSSGNRATVARRNLKRRAACHPNWLLLLSN